MPRQKNVKKEEVSEVVDDAIAKFGRESKNEIEIKEKPERKGKARFGMFLLIILALMAAAYGGYYFSSLREVKNNSEVAKIKETEELLGKVGSLIELPEGETPSVATVSDKEKLKEQTFFKKTENGDKVLIYVQAEKAILYRPSVNKIIEVAPVYMNKTKDAVASAPAENVKNIENVQDNQESQAVQEEVVKIALYNGTTTVGLTKKTESFLRGKMSKIEIVTKDNAKKNDYIETIVVNVSGNREKEAKEIAELLGGRVAPMPEGETSDAEIAVILAK